MSLVSVYSTRDMTLGDNDDAPNKQISHDPACVGGALKLGQTYFAGRNCQFSIASLSINSAAGWF